MPIGALVGKGTVFEDGTASYMARIVGPDGSNIQQADLTAITNEVFDAAGTSVFTATLVIADTIFDSLQTDARWNPDVDSTGYNFRDDMTATALATGGRFRVEYLFTPTAGTSGNFWVVFNVSAYGVLTS